MTMAEDLARRLRVMVLTDPEARIGPIYAAREALAGGATALQVRWKDGSARDLLELIRAIQVDVRNAGAVLIVNDRLDVALACGADGVHLGDDDLPVEAARRIAPEGFIIGRSVDTPEEAAAAEAAGASYVGYGPIFATSTKRDTGPVVGTAGISAVRAAIRIPIVAIGGIGAEEAGKAIAAGASGVAVVSAVMGAFAPREVTSEVLAAVTENAPH